MRVAVAGGTGLVGREVVEVLTRMGHEPVVLARSTGIDLVSGNGLNGAPDGVGAVVNATNSPASDPQAARAFSAR